MLDRTCRARIARWMGTLALALPALGIARGARAEERIHFQSSPDEPLYELTLQRKGVDPEPARIEIFGGMEASTLRGVNAPPWRPLTARAGLGLGFWSSPTWSLALRSEIAVPLPVLQDEGAGRSLRLGDLEGSHRLRGIGGFDAGRDELGGAIEVTARLDHAGPFSTSFLRRDVGAHPFWDASGTLALTPRWMPSSDAAMVGPVTATLERASIDRPEGAAGFETWSVSGGLGLSPSTPISPHGWLEILGANAGHTRFVAAPVAPRPRLGGVDRIDLRFLHLDDLLVAPEHDFVANASLLLGGSWLWDNVTKEETSTFDFRISAGFHGYFGDDHPSDRVGLGFSIDHGAGFLADGSALTRRWRFELFADTDVMDHRTGGSIRAAMEQLSVPTRPEPERDLGFRHLFASEWYFAFASFLQTGFHHASTNQCLGAGDERWCHQIGAFVRLRQRWAKSDRSLLPEEERGID